MRPDKTIQLDAAIVYQEASRRAVLRALTETHGVDFAAAFLCEHHQAIAKAIRTRLCGHSEEGILRHADTLDRAYRGVQAVLCPSQNLPEP